MDKLSEKIFCCEKCSISFSSERECDSIYSAKRGDYWYNEPYFLARCPNCGSVSRELKVDITGYDKDSGVVDVKIQNEQQEEENKMDGNGAIGGFQADIDAITKKLEQGEKVTPDDIAAVTRNCNNMDMLQFLVIFLLLGYTGGNSSADYWRGKYDAYKELHEGGKDGR